MVKITWQKVKIACHTTAPAEDADAEDDGVMGEHDHYQDDVAEPA
ncbi:hypothetical protein [Streptomyces sp. NPDC001480]